MECPAVLRTVQGKRADFGRLEPQRGIPAG